MPVSRMASSKRRPVGAAHSKTGRSRSPAPRQTVDVSRSTSVALSTVNGKPITEVMSQEIANRLVQRTVNAGAEIVELLKTGSAFYAPSAAVARMVDAIIRDEKKVLPCSACLEGEYGIKDTVIGVPVKIGKNGIEEIIELELTPDEKKALHEAAEVVRGLVKGMGLG